MGESRLEPGVNLSGHLLSEEIGQGGYSRVFRAEPVGGGTAVAIKVAVRPELVAALRTEGAVLRRLQGPRFVRILEEHLDEDPPFFVLELCEGGDLRAHADRLPGKRVMPGRVLELARGILEGVAFAHDEGLVHGDLKPENVLLDGKGDPKLADLGLSRENRRKLLDQETQLAGSQATTVGRVRGTFDYLAPEVRKGGAITPESDVYALGVLLYELLVGARPIGLFRLPAEILGSEPPPEGPGGVLPKELDRVIARALAHDAQDRYPDAGAMLADLLAGDEGVTPTRRAEATTKTLNPLLYRTIHETFGDQMAQIVFLMVGLGVLALWLVAVFAFGEGLGLGHLGSAVRAAPIVVLGFTGLTAAIGLPLWLAHRVERWRFLSRTRRALAKEVSS